LCLICFHGSDFVILTGADCKTMELISLTESCCLGEPTKAKLMLDDEEFDYDM